MVALVPCGHTLCPCRALRRGVTAVRIVRLLPFGGRFERSALHSRQHSSRPPSSIRPYLLHERCCRTALGIMPSFPGSGHPRNDNCLTDVLSDVLDR